MYDVDVGGSTLQGALGGAGTGASIGGSIGGTYGTVIGAVVGAIWGGIDANKKAQDLQESVDMLYAIPNVDPTQTVFRDQLYRERKAVESGFTTDFQVARDIIGKSEAGGMSVAAEMAKTNPGLALMMMTQAGQGADTSINKALGTIGARSMGYTQMINDLINQMAQRKLNVDLMKAQVSMTLSTQAMQDSNTNANAGIMQLTDPSVMDNFKGLFGSNTGKNNISQVLNAGGYSSQGPGEAW
jgi:hypothetical protein